MTQSRHRPDVEEHEFAGHESFPSINVAETVEGLVADRGNQAAAEHAATIARAARALKKDDIASEWDEVYRKIIERRER